MKSPHGQPSPALLRSIRRPYLRHNAEETRGGMIAKRQKTGGARVSQFSRNKTPHCRYPWSSSRSSHPAARFNTHLKHATRGATRCRPGMVALGSFENDLETVVCGTQITVTIARNCPDQMSG
jgi:hypothetical protein